MSLFRRTREVLLVEHPSLADPDRRWSADLGSPSGQVTTAEGPTPEAAMEALRIRVQYAEIRRAKIIRVDW